MELEICENGKDKERRRDERDGASYSREYRNIAKNITGFSLNWQSDMRQKAV